MVRQLILAGIVGAALIGCGDGGDGGGDKPSLLAGAPHCMGDAPVFHVQGTLDGVSIDDARSTNSNVGLVNIGTPSLDTPFSTSVSLAANQVELHLKWMTSLAYGQTGAATGDYLMPPSSHPRAGEKVCISAGQVGFVDGGSEDGGFKFHITQARAGAGCSVDVPIDLRGCFN